MLSQAISSTTFQRKLNKIRNNQTSACMVNLACFQSGWYLSSQALLQSAEKPLTLSLSLGGGPGRRLAQWLPGSWQVLISSLRWQQRSLSSLFLAPAYLVNSNGSWQELASLWSWQGAAGCLSVAQFARGEHSPDPDAGRCVPEMRQKSTPPLPVLMVVGWGPFELGLSIIISMQATKITPSCGPWP